MHTVVGHGLPADDSYGPCLDSAALMRGQLDAPGVPLRALILVALAER